MTLQSRHCSGRSNSIAERLVFVLSLFLVAILADRHRIKRVRASKPLCTVSSAKVACRTTRNETDTRSRAAAKKETSPAALVYRRGGGGFSVNVRGRAATRQRRRRRRRASADPTGPDSKQIVGYRTRSWPVIEWSASTIPAIAAFSSGQSSLSSSGVAPPSPISKNLACFVYSFKKIIDNNNILYSRLHNCTENRQNYCCQSALRRAQNGLLILPVYLHLKAPSGMWILTNF